MTASPTPPQTQTIEGILARLAVLSTEADAIKLEADSLKNQLLSLHDLGQIDSRLEQNGWQFQWSAGRQTYDYPDDIAELEADLQAAREAAVATGRATLKPANPFWTIHKPSSKRQKEVQA